MAKNENIKIKFLGMTFESTNSGRTTILILAMILIFFLALVTLLCLFKALPANALRKGELYPLGIIERTHHET
ncbi:hypothetical protein LQ567_16505 [Niabella pedocola]|uniref:Uncharacterized protein n=1 Tax=Niabella pedocola TaxID=1752077 RepID=A0ABS8PTI5_9BACT|nr:hypothetical protein [Niabella pedocola]MCD2424383.1 hypothetical protein [Niabella pedocola]